MRVSHRELEPDIYPAALEFRFHPGKVLIDLADRENGAFVGGFSLHDWDLTGKTCELGYWVMPQFRAQGLMQEGAKELLDYLFGERGLQRVSLVCDTRNLRSITLAKRLGFQQEAFLSGVDLVTAEPVIKLVFARYS